MQQNPFNPQTPLIYLSPHLDDAVLSCGGMIWQQAQVGYEVQIWTLFAGDPPDEDLSAFAQSLHERWEIGENSVNIRREEDAQACQFLGASYQHFDFPDCIYRRFPQNDEAVIMGEEDLFHPSRLEEDILLARLLAQLTAALPREYQLISPLTLGGHVDHLLARRLAENIAAQPWYYADYPYVEQQGEQYQFDIKRTHTFQLPEESLLAWQNAVAAYRSQISTFWQGEEQMRSNLASYKRSGGGSRLFQF